MGEYDAKKAKQKSLAERWRAKEQCLKVAMSVVFFAFCRRKTGKEVVSKTNQWIFKKRIWNRLLQQGHIQVRRIQRIRISPVWGWNNMKACRKRYKWKTPKDGRKYIDSRPFPGMN